MRIALKRWLQSHWNEMSASDRATFPQQTLFLVPGGAGITSMREQYQHWLQILMTVTGFVLFDRLRQRGQPDACSRDGAPSPDIREHGAGSARVATGEPASHRKNPALIVRRRGGPSHSE